MEISFLQFVIVVTNSSSDSIAGVSFRSSAWSQPPGSVVHREKRSASGLNKRPGVPLGVKIPSFLECRTQVVGIHFVSDHSFLDVSHPSPSRKWTAEHQEPLRFRAEKNGQRSKVQSSATPWVATPPPRVWSGHLFLHTKRKSRPLVWTTHLFRSRYGYNTDFFMALLFVVVSWTHATNPVSHAHTYIQTYIL